MFRRVLLLFTGLALLAPGLAQAHNADQLPFVAINDKDLVVYHVGSVSVKEITLPQDEPAESYLVGQSLHFQLRTANLPFPAELIPSLKFTWDFGDGSRSSEREPKHAYAKMGSYIVTLTAANPAEGVEPQVLDIIYLNVLPTAAYQLPTSVIAVDGKKSANAYTDILSSDFSRQLEFEAGDSRGGSAPIKGYQWDFGDQQQGSETRMSHGYSRDWSYISVMLRVTNTDGFFTDSMVQIENPNPVFGTAAPTPEPVLSKYRTWAVAGLAGLLVVVAVFLRGVAAKRKANPQA